MDEIKITQSTSIHKGKVFILYRLEYGFTILYKFGLNIEKNEFCAVISDFGIIYICTPYNNEIKILNIYGYEDEIPEYNLFGIFVIWQASDSYARLVYDVRNSNYSLCEVVVLGEYFVILRCILSDDEEELVVYKKGNNFICGFDNEDILNYANNIKIAGDFLYINDMKINLNDFNIILFSPEKEENIVQKIIMPCFFVAELHKYRTENQKNVIITMLLIFRRYKFAGNMKKYLLSFL